MVEGIGWRIVRLKVPPEKREGPEDTGQRDWIELAQGKDLMGVTRWEQIDIKRAGVSELIRVVNKLKEMVVAGVETNE